MPVAGTRLSATRQGLQYKLAEGRFSSAARMALGKTTSGTTTEVTLPTQAPPSGKPFGMSLNGYLYITQAGVYTFHLHSDDGALLRIGRKEVVNNDGAHSAQTQQGMIALAEGWHPIEVLYFDAGGDRQLRLLMSLDRGQPQPLPPDYLAH